MLTPIEKHEKRQMQNIRNNVQHWSQQAKEAVQKLDVPDGYKGVIFKKQNDLPVVAFTEDQPFREPGGFYCKVAGQYSWFKDSSEVWVAKPDNQ